MIAVSVQPSRLEVRTVSFASTLYLRPILNLLLMEVAPLWRQDMRLGLQEALVNAAYHGNCLDPRKRITVQFAANFNQYVWTITDEGCGFATDTTPNRDPCVEQECGRGLHILRQIFDEVEWLPPGNRLRLCKYIRRDSRPYLL